MSFRCIFIVKQDDPDIKDLQPFCYKSFNNFNKKNLHSKSILPLHNFNEWYYEIFKTLKDGNYTAFSENNIDEHLSNPLFSVKTKFGVYSPCIIIIKKKYAFGGLIYDPDEIKKKYYANCVDFIINMSIYFLDIINKNSKIKMSDVLSEFYQYIRTLCPYGTPIINSSNLVELLKLPDNSIKQIHQAYEKRLLPIDQLNISTNSKTSNIKEVKCYNVEIVTCVQHENRSGEPKYDTDILGEFHVNCSGFSPNDEILLRLQLGKSSQFMNSCIITDLLTVSTNLIKCTYKTPATVSMEIENINVSVSQQMSNDYSSITGLTMTSHISDISLNSTLLPSSLLNHQSSLVSSNLYLVPASPTNSVHSSCSNVSETPSYMMNQQQQHQQKHKLNRESSVTSSQSTRRNSIAHTIQSISNPSETIDVLFRAPNSSDNVLLFKYRLMCCKDKRPTSNSGFDLAFVESLRMPQPPLLCTYQLEEDSLTGTAQLIFKINMNPEFLGSGSTFEFSKLEVLFPFPNRQMLLDVSKCNASQGKNFIMEQNRRIMFWSVGTNIKFKSEISLIGQIKFKQDGPMNEFLDKFSVPPNAHAQVNFTLKSMNLSGLTVDPNCVTVNKGKSNVKLMSKSECQSFNFKVWNFLGDCFMEMT